MSAALQTEARTPIVAPLPKPIVAKPGAYRWWYFDAVSDDGTTSLVVIFFLGSVFSPYYAARLARGEAAMPIDHVAVNVALYGPGGHLAWAFSEYAGDRFEERADGVRVAGSRFERHPGGRVVLHLDDRRTLSGKPVRGQIAFEPEAAPLTTRPLTLAPGHEWRCHAPSMRVRARFLEPGLAFEGQGYHDENWGPEPPARAMRSWSWVRGGFGARHRVVFDTVAVDGTRSLLSVDSRDGLHRRALPARTHRPALGSWLLPLPGSFEGGLADDGRALHLGQPLLLERSPFYARFLAPFPSPGGPQPGRGVPLGFGEHVDFSRFAQSLVRFLVGFRVARPDRGDPGWLP